MKPFKRLDPIFQLKSNADDNLADKFESAVKLMINCFNEFTHKVQKKVETLNYNSNYQPHKNDAQKDYNQQVHFTRPLKFQQKTERSQKQNEEHKPLPSQNRKQQRFQNVNVPIQKIRGQAQEQRLYEILDWVGYVCRQVLSVGFLMFKSEQLQVHKIKSYCSENIIRNIIKYSQLNNLTSLQIQQINKSLKKQILPYFCLKYPQTEESAVNMSFARQLIQRNNIQQNSNDLIYKSGVKFRLQNSGNYNSQIMEFLNFIIKFPHKIVSQDDDASRNVNLGNAQSLSLAKSFKIDMEKYFRQVQVQSNVYRMLKFNPRDPFEHLSMKQELQAPSQKQKQTYLQKVRSYTSFQIGSKLSENFPQFTQQQIKSGNLKLSNSSMMRIATKWCQQLQKNYDSEFILNMQTQFRMIDGSEKFIKKFHLIILNLLLQKQKQKIVQQLQSIRKNNYYYQSLFAKQKIDRKLNKFGQEQAIVGQFTTLIFRNSENYLINYLNLLIHGILSAMENYQKFIRTQYHKQWVLAKFRYLPVNQLQLMQIMNKVYSNQSNQDVSGFVPQLINFKLGDLLRCKCASRQTQITALYKEIERLNYSVPGLIKIVRVKNRLDQGNKDILMNVMYKKQLLVQVQLAIKSQKSKFITYSNQFNHFFYQLKRAEFGPISQMCSIWVNNDLRSSQYINYLQQTHIRKIKNSQTNLLKRSKCCLQKQNTTVIRLPFNCNSCKCFYYQCNFTENHIICKICEKNTCFLCQIEQVQKSSIKQYLPELKVTKSFNYDNMQFINKLPINGGALLNLTSKVRKVKIFKTIQDRGQYYLFQNIGGRQELKINLLHKFCKLQFPESFLMDNIVYTSPQIEQIIPPITREIVQQQYVIPKYFKQAYKAVRKSLTQTKVNLNESIFREGLDYIWDGTQKINFSENLFQNIDLLYRKFPHIKLAVLSSNQIQEISAQCKNWKRMKYLYLGSNQIKQVHKNISQMYNLVQLDLSQNKIESLPQQIGRLKRLKILNLDCNHLSELPQGIGSLDSLVQIIVANNRLKKFPDSMGNLKSLELLHIWSNGPNLTQFPQSFSNLTNLTEIKARDCGFKKLPKQFGKLQKLRELILQQNKMEDLGESFGLLQSLKELNLQRNKLEKLPANFASLKSLKDCNLYKNNIKQLPETIGEMKQLAFIDLSHNQVASIPDSIGKLPKLEKLILSNNKLKQFNKNICRIKTLKIIFIDQNQISEIPNSIVQLKSLIGLGLDGNGLENVNIPIQIKSLRGLLGIGLSKNKLTKFPEFILEMPWLQNINLESNEITRMPKQAQNLINLKMLMINEEILDQDSKRVYDKIQKICSHNQKKQREVEKNTQKIEQYPYEYEHGYGYGQQEQEEPLQVQQKGQQDYGEQDSAKLGLSIYEQQQQSPNN